MIEKKDLLEYEAPSISEFVFWNWGQSLVAKYLGWKINRKWRRLEARKKRAAFVKSFSKK